LFKKHFYKFFHHFLFERNGLWSFFMLETKRKEFYHCADGKDAWALGYSGFFHRIRGILSQIFVTLVGGGAITWFTLAKDTFVPLALVLAILIIIICISSFMFWVFFRKNAKKHLETRSTLHSLSHRLRDIAVDSEKAIKLSSSSLSFEDKSDNLRKTCNNICEAVRTHFNAITGEDTACAIRLVHTLHPQSDEISDGIKTSYATIGRSQGFNENRKDTSYLPADKGAAKFFLYESDTQSKGVLIYNNLDTAAEKGVYYKTENDISFPNDVRTMMVAPINGWDGEEIKMIGLLHVTSRKSPFYKKHVDAMRSVADMIATTLPLTLNSILYDSQIRTRGAL
jgi:hypothetical protein